MRSLITAVALAVGFAAVASGQVNCVNAPQWYCTRNAPTCSWHVANGACGYSPGYSYAPSGSGSGGTQQMWGAPSSGSGGSSPTTFSCLGASQQECLSRSHICTWTPGGAASFAAGTSSSGPSGGGVPCLNAPQMHCEAASHCVWTGGSCSDAAGSGPAAATSGSAAATASSGGPATGGSVGSGGPPTATGSCTWAQGSAASYTGGSGTGSAPNHANTSYGAKCYGMPKVHCTSDSYPDYNVYTCRWSSTHGCVAQCYFQGQANCTGKFKDSCQWYPGSYAYCDSKNMGGGAMYPGETGSKPSSYTFCYELSQGGCANRTDCVWNATDLYCDQGASSWTPQCGGLATTTEYFTGSNPSSMGGTDSMPKAGTGSAATTVRRQATGSDDNDDDVKKSQGSTACRGANQSSCMSYDFPFRYSYCMWTGITHGCVPACRYQDKANCTTRFHGQCDFVEKACAMKLQAHGAGSGSAGAYVNGSGGSGYAAYIPTDYSTLCGNAATKAACEGFSAPNYHGYYCAWDGSTCKRNCLFRQTEAQCTGTCKWESDPCGSSYCIMGTLGGATIGGKQNTVYTVKLKSGATGLAAETEILVIFNTSFSIAAQDVIFLTQSTSRRSADGTQFKLVGDSANVESAKNALNKATNGDSSATDSLGFSSIAAKPEENTVASACATLGSYKCMITYGQFCSWTGSACTAKATQTPAPMSDYCKRLTTVSACTTKPWDKNCLWIGNRCVAKQAPKVNAPIATTASGAPVPTTVSGAPVATSSAAGSVGSAISSGNAGGSTSGTPSGGGGGGNSGTAALSGALATFVALALTIALN